MQNPETMVPVVSSNMRLLFGTNPKSKIEYAKKHFVAPSTITKWCSGNMKTFDIQNLYNVSAFFGVPIQWFFKKHDTVKAHAVEKA